MRRRELIALIGGGAVAWPITARAQQTERMRRLGVLMAVAESDADARKGISILKESLQKLGWKDGNNIRIDYRWGNGNPDRIEDLAKELVVSLGTKWLEILKQIVPGVRRVTAMFNPDTAPYYGLYLQID
jgi:ABC-type uncharacterized transport system substrate-binding protein